MTRTRGAAALLAWLENERRSQAWLGEQTGHHQTSVSAWIRGRAISLDGAIAVQRVTGIPIEEWSTRAEESGPTLHDSVQPPPSTGTHG